MVNDTHTRRRRRLHPSHMVWYATHKLSASEKELHMTISHHDSRLFSSFCALSLQSFDFMPP